MDTCYIIHLAYDRTFEFDHEEKLLSKLPSVYFHLGVCILNYRVVSIANVTKMKRKYITANYSHDIFIYQ